MPPSWTSGAKDFVTTALGKGCVWATLGEGIVNEVYWPSTGDPQVRDLGFIVAGQGFWSEVKRASNYRVRTPAPHLPLPTVVHEDDPGRSRLELTVVCDPRRDALLIRYELDGEGLELFALLAPHLGVSGWGNTAWVEAGRLFAQRGGDCLCLLADPAFEQPSAGFAGESDLWQDFADDGHAAWSFERATDGNVALSGRLAPPTGLLALAFAKWPEGAHTLAASSLAEGYEAIRAGFIAGWSSWDGGRDLPSPSPEIHEQARLSATLLKAHQDRSYRGATPASLSVPWGDVRDDPGGYHLVWPRDLVETGLALFAIGERDDALAMLEYLAATQQASGRWAQNFHPNGRPYWHGVQLDEAALPIVLASKLREAGLGDHPRIAAMVRRAAAYIARHGPATPQDRWEDASGMNPFTLAAEVAALVAASEYLEGDDRGYALALADSWNRCIEHWTYEEGSCYARDLAVAGHYVRMGSAENRPCRLVGLEFMALARFGLRDPDDPRLRNTLKVVDAVLRVDTPSGPAYRRYLGDTYGEHGDGTAPDGGGIGRSWPLLTGERGVFGLQRGEDPLPYLRAMCAMASPTGLIPEQVWDAEPIPERGLFPGRPTGGAMPLVWAHAEFLKLLLCREVFLRSGECRPVELLDAVRNRYRDGPVAEGPWLWRDDAPFPKLPPGRDLVVEDRRPFRLHFGFGTGEAWQDVGDRTSTERGLGMHGATIPAEELAGRAKVHFTRWYPQEGRWEDPDHGVELSCAPPAARGSSG